MPPRSASAVAIPAAAEPSGTGASAARNAAADGHPAVGLGPLRVEVTLPAGARAAMPYGPPSISTSASQFTGAFKGSIIPIDERACVPTSGP